MAAALTIGESLKQAQPAVYGNSRNTSLRTQQPQTRSQGSLLKRSSSIQGPLIRATSTPKTSRTSSHLSNGRPQLTQHVEYSVDDSFNDSTLERIGQEADSHYSNRARVSDLQLHHTPAAPPPVKMVKKYVPTPNGIQVIEVPEAAMKKEIARSNSIRSGMSLSRSGLMSRGLRLSSLNRTYLFSGQRPPRPQASHRQGSLLSSLKIVENVDLERQSASETAAAQQKIEHEQLKRQIEEEKRLAKELDQQRLEFERLKELRLQNERKFRELRELEEEEARSRTMSPVSVLNPATLTGSFPEEKPPTITLDQHQESVPVREEEEEVEDEEEEDVPIPPSSIIVDEFDQKKIEEEEHETQVPIAHPIPVSANEHTSQTVPDVQEMPSPSEYSLEVGSTESPSRRSRSSPTVREHIANDTFSDGKDEFGIEEVPDDDFDTPNLAQQLRPVFDPINDRSTNSVSPRFDPVPEVIDDNLASGRMTPPPLNLATGSINSAGSIDSKGSKPIKSAMKMPKATYLSKSSSLSSPAHQAYLSLTTAENTRLNSKLSSTQLADTSALIPADQRPSPPKSPVTPQKRLSQSLRKQPSTPQAGAMSGRSLRPRSQSDASQTSRANGGGMSSRTFKTQPQPIPPHPALQPNYQSPSKLKAAELYAKANNRPRSQLQPIKRLSSFTKHQEQGAPQTATARPVSQQVQHRTTLRNDRPQSYMPPAYSLNQTDNAPAPAPAHASHASNGGGGFKAFKSRYADSDDEDNGSPSIATPSTKFHSRFNESHEDLPGAGRRTSESAHKEMMQTPIVSLRKQNGKGDAAPKEERPKKKKFLRKLFGKS